MIDPTIVAAGSTKGAEGNLRFPSASLPSDTFAVAFACGGALQTRRFAVAEAPAQPAPPRV